MALVADTVPAEIRSSSGLAHVSGGAHKYVTMGHALEKVIHLQCGPYAKQQYCVMK